MKRVASLPQGNGYLTINRLWSAGDIIQIDFDMPVVLMESNPFVRSNIGKVAIQRGPIVYALEGLDNGRGVDVTLPDSAKFEFQYNSDLLNGIVTIIGRTAYGEPFVAIPYYALANGGNQIQMFGSGRMVILQVVKTGKESSTGFTSDFILKGNLSYIQ